MTNEKTMSGSYKEITVNTDSQPKLLNESYYTHCLICGDRVKIHNNYEYVAVCKECKEAVKFIRDNKQRLVFK